MIECRVKLFAIDDWTILLLPKEAIEIERSQKKLGVAIVGNKRKVVDVI